MRRLKDWSRDQIIEYNLRGGGEEFTVFEEGQPARVEKAREIIRTILAQPALAGKLATIVEPGCSTGDIAGYFAEQHNVIGIDVTPGACRVARQRWPEMAVLNGIAENEKPIPCDILVLCEFLEHIVDPVGFIESWAPHARYIVIGHPLVGNGYDNEPGHLWAYDDNDYRHWFELGGYEARTAWTFEMAGYLMIIGWGERQ